MADAPPPYAPTDEKSGPYPPEQTGPLPQQAGYPPQQPGYPPQQPGYPPQQPSYPPQQPGYPPQQPSYPPQQPGYPPQQPGYPPQQAGYPPQQPVQTQPQVQVTNTVVSYGNNPVRIQCSNCKTEQVTVLRRSVGALNWIVCGITALVLFILGFELLIPFFLIPFAFIALCIPPLMDVEHVCPNCNFTNGTHRAM